MRTKIASPIVLQSELQRIATYTRMPQPSRQVIAAELSQLAKKVSAQGSTWTRQLGDLQEAFLSEVMKEAEGILQNEGWGRIKITGPRMGGRIDATKAGTGDFTLSLAWAWQPAPNTMVGIVSMGGPDGLDEKKLKISVTSHSAMQVASQAIYAHFEGLLP
jgi:hypothetical protein